LYVHAVKPQSFKRHAALTFSAVLCSSLARHDRMLVPLTREACPSDKLYMQKISA